MEEKDIKLSDFSIQLGLAVDQYIETAIKRIMFLEAKIIEYYKKTGSVEFKEFFEISEQNTTEVINHGLDEVTKEEKPVKKSKMKIVK